MCSRTKWGTEHTDARIASAPKRLLTLVIRIPLPVIREEEWEDKAPYKLKAATQKAEDLLRAAVCPSEWARLAVIETPSPTWIG